MTSVLGATDYSIIGLMLVGSVVVGVYFRFTGGRQKSTSEFLMAGKEMSVLPVAFSLMATCNSAIAVLGIPAEIYMYGTQYITYHIGFPFGLLAAAYFFLPVFFEVEANTIYEYLEKRFGKCTKAVVSFLFVLKAVLYLGVTLYAPSLALNAITGLSTWTSVITLAVVCILYCSLGGMKAVLWTDVFQSLFMYVTTISIVVKAAVYLGGMQNVSHIANEGGRFIFNEFSLDMTKRYTFWSTFTNGIIFGASLFGTDQTQVQRMMSVRSLETSRRALFLSLPLIFAFEFFSMWDGVAIYSTFHDCDPVLQASNSAVSSTDQLLPYFIVTMFGGTPGLAGLCFCGVFSASLSTISSVVNSLATVTMEDFVRPQCFARGLTETWATFVAKILVVAYGSLGILMTVAISSFRGVLEAATILTGMITGPVLGLFSLGVLTSVANEQGSLVGLFAGFALDAWLGYGSSTSNIKVPSLPRSIEGCRGLHNETFDILANNASFLTLLGANCSVIDGDNIVQESDDGVLVVYKLSYLWFPTVGALTTFVVGCISSYIIGFFVRKKTVSKILIAPAFRMCYFNVDKSSHEEHQMKEVEDEGAENKTKETISTRM